MNNEIHGVSTHEYARRLLERGVPTARETYNAYMRGEIGPEEIDRRIKEWDEAHSGDRELPNVTDLAGPTVESRHENWIYSPSGQMRIIDSVTDGYYEPGNGTRYALAALRLTPGEWPGTKGLALPVLVSAPGFGSYTFDLGPGVLHASYIRQHMGGSVCDASAIVRWLEGFPGAEFTPVVTCSCGRNGHDA